MERATHVVKRRERVEADQAVCLSNVCVNGSHVVNGFRDRKKCVQVVRLAWLLRLRIGKQRRLGLDDLSPLILQSSNEALPLLVHACKERRDDRHEYERHVLQPVVDVLGQLFVRRAGHAWDMLGELGRKRDDQDST